MNFEKRFYPLENIKALCVAFEEYCLMDIPSYEVDSIGGRTL